MRWGIVFKEAMMRFDLLLAMFSTGLYAPLALMAGGFILAVGGLAALIWRRKKRANASPKENETPGDAPEHTAVVESTEVPDTASAASASAPAPAPEPQEGRRRRSLVSGAEQETGTPAGGIAADDDAHNEGSEFNTFEDAGEDEPEWSDDEVDEDSHDLAEETADTANVAYADAGATVGVAATAADAEEIAEAEETVQEHPDEDEQSGQAEVTASLPAGVAETRAHPIVHRQFMPQSPEEDGLSFFGGLPIGPADFRWPRERGAGGGAPLQFIMQWDCTQLSEQDASGLLPKDGVLYCFINNDHDGDDEFLASHTFLHHSGEVRTWGPIAAPEDAGPALGKASAFLMSGCTGAVENAESFAPRALPRFPFAPVAFDYPGADKDARALWTNEDAAGALIAIQNRGAAVPQDMNVSDDDQHGLDRPFPSFPHDFGAIRVMASRMIEALEDPDRAVAEALFPDLSAEERKAQFAQWSIEAKEIYQLGTQRRPSHKLDQAICDDVWAWFAQRGGILDTSFSDLVVEAVDLSIGVGSEALGSVPSRWIDKAMNAHALADGLALDNDAPGRPSKDNAVPPVRMFGPPSELSSEAASIAQDNIMLLELPSGAGPQHHFLGRTLQYWIAPDDLASGKFEQVRLTIG